MSRTSLIPILVSASLIFTAVPAAANMVFDFIPRLDFVEQPKSVTKTKSKTLILPANTNK